MASMSMVLAGARNDENIFKRDKWFVAVVPGSSSSSDRRTMLHNMPREIECGLGTQDDDRLGSSHSLYIARY